MSLYMEVILSEENIRQAIAWYVQSEIETKRILKTEVKIVKNNEDELKAAVKMWINK